MLRSTVHFISCAENCPCAGHTPGDKSLEEEMTAIAETTCRNRKRRQYVRAVSNIGHMNFHNINWVSEKGCRPKFCDFHRTCSKIIGPGLIIRIHYFQLPVILGVRRYLSREYFCQTSRSCGYRLYCLFRG
jgi:hypothetical protein